MHTCIVGITTYFQRKTTVSKDWQRLSKVLPCKSVNQKGLTFSISSPLISTGSISVKVSFDISSLHFLHLKSGLGLRWPLTFEQHLSTQKPQTRHLIELDPTPLLHTRQGNLLASTSLWVLCTLTMIFVLPTFAHRASLVFQKIAHHNTFLDTVKSFLLFKKSKIKIYMFAQVLFMNLSQDKDCTRRSSPRHETKLHDISVRLSSYHSCKYVFNNFNYLN